MIARMASDRFPGKVVAPLYGKTVLEHCIEGGRLMGVPVMVATSYQVEDDPIAEVAERTGAGVFRGEAEDLFSRESGAIAAGGLTHAIMISGDSPFADVNAGRMLVEAIRAHPGYDTYGVGPWPQGTFGFQVAAKARAYYDKAREVVYAKEGVLLSQYWVDIQEEVEYTTHITDASSLFIGFERTAGVSLTVDYQFDLVITELICRQLGRCPHSFAEAIRAYKLINWEGARRLFDMVPG